MTEHFPTRTEAMATIPDTYKPYVLAERAAASGEKPDIENAARFLKFALSNDGAGIEPPLSDDVQDLVGRMINHVDGTGMPSRDFNYGSARDVFLAVAVNGRLALLGQSSVLKGSADV